MPTPPTPPPPGIAGPTEPPPGDSDDGTLLREALRAHLGRVDAALRQWDAWAAARRRPPETQPRVPQPPLSLPSLTELRATLTEELARLDAEADADTADA